MIESMPVLIQSNSMKKIYHDGRIPTISLF